MKNLKLIIVITLFVHANIYAQDFSLTIAKASDNDFTKGKPAEFIGTFPSSDTLSNSWLANGFLETSLTFDSSRLTIGLSAELHKNTLIEKEQDVRQYGVTIGRVFMLSKDSIDTSTFDLPITLNFKSSSDKIKETDELQIILGISFDRKVGWQILKTKSLFPRYDTNVGKAIMFSHDHNFGLAYLGEDKIMLGQFDFEVNSFLLPILVNEWIGRYDLLKAQFTFNSSPKVIGDTERDLTTRTNFQFGLNIPFGADDINSIGVVYDWYNGANPLKGLEDQKYETLTVKAKIVL